MATSLLSSLDTSSHQHAASSTNEDPNKVLLSAISQLLSGLQTLNLLWNQNGEATSITLSVELAESEMATPVSESSGHEGPVVDCGLAADVAADSAHSSWRDGTGSHSVPRGSEGMLEAEEQIGNTDGNGGESSKLPSGANSLVVRETVTGLVGGAGVEGSDVLQASSGGGQTGFASGWEEAQAVVREGRIGPVGMTAIASALERGGGAGLQSLYLGSNDIGDMGIAALAGALERGGGAKIRLLFLEDNGIGDPGAAALAWALERGGGKALEILHLGYNKIGDAGAAALAWALKRGGGQRLHTLDLAYNKIGDIGAKALAGTLDRNWSQVKGLEMLELQAIVMPEGLTVEGGQHGQLYLTAASDASGDGHGTEEDASNQGTSGADVSQPSGGGTRKEAREEGSPKASVVVQYMLVHNDEQNVRDVLAMQEVSSVKTSHDG